MLHCAIPKYTRIYRIFQNIPQLYPQVFCLYKNLTLLIFHFFPISQPVFFFFLARHVARFGGSFPTRHPAPWPLAAPPEDSANATGRIAVRHSAAAWPGTRRLVGWRLEFGPGCPKKMPGKPLGFLHVLCFVVVFQGEVGGGLRSKISEI